MFTFTTIKTLFLKKPVLKKPEERIAELISKINRQIYDDSYDLEVVKEDIEELKNLKAKAVDFTGNKGMTAVMFAFDLGKYDIALVLMENGATLNKVAENGWTVLNKFIDEERLPQIKLLVWFDTFLLRNSNELLLKKINSWDTLMKQKYQTSKNENKVPQNILEILNNSIEDSRKVQELLALTKGKKVKQSVLAKYFLDIAKIYYKQLEIEEKFTREQYALFPHTDTHTDFLSGRSKEGQDDQFRAVAFKFYQTKAIAFIKKADEIYRFLNDSGLKAEKEELDRLKVDILSQISSPISMTHGAYSPDLFASSSSASHNSSSSSFDLDDILGEEEPQDDNREAMPLMGASLTPYHDRNSGLQKRNSPSKSKEEDGQKPVQLGSGATSSAARRLRF